MAYHPYLLICRLLPNRAKEAMVFQVDIRQQQVSTIFDDFEIAINAEEPPVNGSNVTVRYNRGIRTGNFSLSSVADAVGQLDAAIQQAEPLPSALERGGGLLFDALFSGRVLEAFRESITLAHGRQHGVRLRLYSELPSIIAVPWEYLYDHMNGSWLALHPMLSLVRALPLAAGDPLPVKGPLRVLVMLSAPTDLVQLDSVQEWANVEMATAAAAIDLIRVEPTYAALQEALRQPCHIFHFVGHGIFDEVSQQGSLALQTQDGTAEFIAMDQLSILLAGCKTLRLVFLNACQGAATGTRSAFAGIAQRLIQQEVAAVLAMQASIADDHALRFSQEFYSALADGLCVEEAVREGRKRINEVAWTWGIPAFYFQGTEPFAITPLDDVQKAAQLWQKVQSKLGEPSAPISQRNVIEQSRNLLNQILKLDSGHSGAQQYLQQLDNESKAVQLYMEGVAQQEQQHWREAHRALEQVERLFPNYRDTRSRLAEVLGKLDHTLPVAPPDERRRQFQPLLNALMEGRFVPFLGWDAVRFGRPPRDTWVKGQYPPDAVEIARELATRLGTPLEGLPSLIHVSQLTTLLDDEVALYERLYELIAADYPPTLLHRLLAELPSRLQAKHYPKRADWRLVIFSTALDDLLERAFLATGQPYHLFAYRHRLLDANGVVRPGGFVHIPPNGEAIEMITPNTYNNHDHDHYPLIVKLCGLHVTPDPDSVMVTEDQYLEYLPGQEIGSLLPATLLNQVKKRMFVFFGCTSQEWHFRLLWQRMKYQKSYLHAKAWAILAQPSEIELRFWDKLDKNIETLPVAPEVVVATINEWLDAL